MVWDAVTFVGVPASGKTSFYLQRFFDTHVRISLDVLRTRHREELLLAACLRAKQSFVIDNTNPLPQHRARYVGLARATGFHVSGYFFETSLADAIRRNNQRTGTKRIPTAALAAAFRKLQPPTFEEGFDALYTVRIAATRNAFIVDSIAPLG